MWNNGNSGLVANTLCSSRFDLRSNCNLRFEKFNFKTGHYVKLNFNFSELQGLDTPHLKRIYEVKNEFHMINKTWKT